MTNNVAHFSGSNTDEHPANGVQTEFCCSQAIVFMEKSILGWKEKDRLDCLLLQAILALSKDQSEIAQEGFTAWDIAEAISRLRRRPWSTEGDKESMSNDVRRQWKKLEILWNSKSEGISQSFLDEGLSKYPIISRNEGGGTGRPTKYRIEWVNVNDYKLADNNLLELQRIQRPEANVRYICEDIKDPGVLAKIFAKGYLLGGWRRAAYITALFIPLLICLISCLLVIFNLTFPNTLSTKQIGSSIASSLIIIFTVFITVYPLIQLQTKKILLAPWWMQSTDEDRLLEFRKPPRFHEKTLKAVSYSASCPICGGKVSAKSGGFEFFGRIVGRCDEAPVEHIFSFDHVSRIGVFLRK